MFNARHQLPLTSAPAGETVARVRGSVTIAWLPRMANRPDSFPTCRGVSR
jgi:hypothetical protein